MKLKKLTEKEQRFVEEYCRCSNKSEAYQIAFLKDKKSKSGYHRQANKLLARTDIQQAIFMQQISLEKNLKDYDDNLRSLRLVRDKCLEKLGDKRLSYVAIDGVINSIKEINEMLGLSITSRTNIFIKMQELNLKHETLEFNKSKIKTDNEELEKTNISLLAQLADSIKQRRTEQENINEEI
ncbi:terminase small subunit [uncultured Clostridium sp.]|uniref:terminase small subunit n=1 Tax=uncultured Clostridium sp. TaxID=59620 RepID=UPI00258C5EE5|nr:terminase small subunit [uncultured Clostridium sp.]